MVIDLVVKDNCILSVITVIISQRTEARKCAKKRVRAFSTTKLKKKVICLEIRIAGIVLCASFRLVLSLHTDGLSAVTCHQ